MKKFLLCGILVMTLLAMTFQPAQAFAPEPAADYKPIAGSGTADAGNPGEDVTSGSALGAQVGDNTD
ncbi:MAG: hypothetical protein FWF44_09915, partial [Defluviitaleaceae bacterium]|nr:hypothetical protein [Defluviitaleaceae bacterium]